MHSISHYKTRLKMASHKEHGGYECKWVKPPPDELFCQICLCVARHPHQHGNGGCGRVFCHSCVTEHLKTQNNCPNCRGALTIFKDERSDRNIKTLKVYCNNVENGCRWVGELGRLENHKEFCDLILEPCPNKCKENGHIVEVLRKDRRNHLMNECPRRQYECPHCEEMGEFLERTTTHLEICPLVTVNCVIPGCDTVLYRCEVSTHQSVCDYEPVSCKYAEVGCEERPLRKDIQKHEDDHLFHLRITTEAVLALKQQSAEHEEEITALKSKLSEHALLTFKVTKFSELKEKSKTFDSPTFYTSRRGYKMCVAVYANGSGDGKGTHVSVFAHLMKGDYDFFLTWPFTGKVTIELLNQLKDRNHHKSKTPFLGDLTSSIRVVDRKKGVSGYGPFQFISHAELEYQPDKYCLYLKDDTLIFRVSVQVPDHKPWLECTP